MEAKILSELEKILDYEVGRASVIIEAREILGKVKGLQSFYSDLVKKNERQAEENKKLESKSLAIKEVIAEADAEAEKIIEKARNDAKIETENAKAEIKKTRDLAIAEADAANDRKNKALEELSAVYAKRDNAEAELSKINDALAKAKANLKSMLGD